MRDEYSVLLGGAVGTSALVVVMGTADVASRFTLRVFERLAGLAGTPESSVVGVVVFVAIGVFAWPLIYLSLESYLPGDTPTAKGVAFAIPLWIGFVAAFGGAADSILLYAAVALVAHVVYGGAIGFVHERLGDHTIEDE